MNEKNDFALVLRRSSALELAGPGAKQIILGMVAEVLVIARREANELEAIYKRGLEYEKSGEQNQAFFFTKKLQNRDIFGRNTNWANVIWMAKAQGEMKMKESDG